MGTFGLSQERKVQTEHLYNTKWAELVDTMAQKDDYKEAVISMCAETCIMLSVTGQRLAAHILSLAALKLSVEVQDAMRARKEADHG